MRLFNSRRGYFFIIDAIIAFFVLVLGMVLALSFFTHEVSDEQVTFFSMSIMEFFSENKLEDLNNDYAGPGGVLHQDNNITNLKNSLLVQIGEFYYRNKTLHSNFTLDIIENLITNVTEDLVSERYNYYLIIEDEIVYNKSSLDINKSLVLVPSKKIIHGIYNDSVLWGPYSVEVWTWR